MALDMHFAEGDMQFLKNSVVLHARTEYEDAAEPDEKRHLLRLWLTATSFRDGDDALRRRRCSDRDLRSQHKITRTFMESKESLNERASAESSWHWWPSWDWFVEHARTRKLYPCAQDAERCHRTPPKLMEVELHGPPVVSEVSRSIISEQYARNRARHVRLYVDRSH